MVSPTQGSNPGKDIGSSPVPLDVIEAVEKVGQNLVGERSLANELVVHDDAVDAKPWRPLCAPAGK